MRCGAEACSSATVCKGFCDKHYRRWRKWGSPEMPAAQCPECGTVFRKNEGKGTSGRIWCSVACKQRVSYRNNAESRREAKRVWYRQPGSKEAVRQKGDTWRVANLERSQMANRRSWLSSTYQLSTEAYDAMLEAQGGVCLICKRGPAEKRLRVDHDHACCPGKKSCGECIRGLLCMHCNGALGWFEKHGDRVLGYLEDNR